MAEEATVGQFILEEYREKWAYVRHTEQMQGQSIQWYLTMVGGTLAYSVSLGSGADGLAQMASPVGSVGRLLCPFLLVYSAFLALLLLFQKRNYKRFTDRLLEIERAYCGLDSSFGSARRVTVFRLRYTMVNLVGGACAGMMVYAWGGAAVWASVALLVYVSSLYLLSLATPFQH
jgi:hypothetical protein